jgi:hypothetical protein
VREGVVVYAADNWTNRVTEVHMSCRMGYFRHGTLSLYAALETRGGQLIGSTASRHTSQEFVRFLQEVVATQPSAKEIHLIVDNLSAHKTKRVERLQMPWLSNWVLQQASV